MADEKRSGAGSIVWPARPAPEQSQPPPQQQTTTPAISMQLALRSAAEQQAALVAQRAAQEQQAQADAAEYALAQGHQVQAEAALRAEQLAARTALLRAVVHGVLWGGAIALAGFTLSRGIKAAR